MTQTMAQPDDVLETLRSIWEEVLDLDGITPEDDFFELGGDSLLGVTMIGKARHAGIVIAFKDLETNPRLGQLAAQVQA